MIRVERPPGEPKWLATNRGKRLPALRAQIAASGTFDPKSIDGYQVARQPLFAAQHRKCCYCERQPFSKHQVVEHYRPKSVYWWLSWDWRNLLFCCQRCNEHKGADFPLLAGVCLVAEAAPPGTERSGILDPVDGAADPVDHIQFRLTPRGWVPFPRNGSRRGYETIRACKLDATDLLDAYTVHARQFESSLRQIRSAMKTADAPTIRRAWEDVVTVWLSVSQPFTALSRDILDRHFPPTMRKRYGLTLDLRPALYP